MNLKCCILFYGYNAPGSTACALCGNLYVLMSFFNIGYECIIPIFIDYVLTNIASCVQHTSTHTLTHTYSINSGNTIKGNLSTQQAIGAESFVLFELTHTGVVAMSKSTFKRPSASFDKEGTEEETKTEEMAEEPSKTENEGEEEKEKTPKKPKAKSCPKGKAKSKAKAKAKAASKQKQHKDKKEKKEKKKHKDTKEKNEEDDAPKKENLNDKCEKWKAAVDGAEKEQDQKDNSEEEGELRDRGKARKFQKLKDAGSIPDHILAMFEHESKKQDKPRSYKTALINRLFKPDGKGGYEMCASDPWFQQQKEIMHSKYGKDEQIGSPKDVFLYSTFQGNSSALQSAIDNGSVQEWNQDGIVYCGFRQTKSGVKSAKTDTTSMGSGEVNLEQKQWAALTKAFKTMSWSFANTDDMVPSLGSSSSSTQQKQLENIGLTDAMKNILTEAKAAQEKLHGTAMKLLNKCTSADDKKKFKTTVMQLKEFALKNDHVLTWNVPWPNFHMYLNKGLYVVVLISV